MGEDPVRDDPLHAVVDLRDNIGDMYKNRESEEEREGGERGESLGIPDSDESKYKSLKEPQDAGEGSRRRQPGEHVEGINVKLSHPIHDLKGGSAKVTGAEVMVSCQGSAVMKATLLVVLLLGIHAASQLAV
jgi:hypothetical protein